MVVAMRFVVVKSGVTSSIAIGRVILNNHIINCHIRCGSVKFMLASFNALFTFKGLIVARE